MRAVRVVLVLALVVLVAGVVPTRGQQRMNLQFWYSLGGLDGQVVAEMVNKFDAEHPDIVVEGVFTGSYPDTARKVIAALAAKTAPDLGLIPAGPLWASQKGGTSILPYARGPNGIDMRDVFEVFWEYNSYQGQVYTMPFNNSVPLMYYNKDLFKKAGLDPNRPPATWEELVRYARALTRDVNADGRIDQWGLNMHGGKHWYFEGFLYQNGGRYITSDTSRVIFDSPAGVEALQFWSDLVRRHKVMPPGEQAIASRQFVTGQLGMLFRSSGGLASLLREIGGRFELGAAPLPAGPKGRAVTIGGAMLVMFETPRERQQAAWELIKWMTEPLNAAEWATKTGYIPIRRSAIRTARYQEFLAANPLYRLAPEVVRDHGYAKPQYWEIGTADEAVQQAIEQVEFGRATPEAALRGAAAKVNAEIKQRPQ